MLNDELKGGLENLNLTQLILIQSILTYGYGTNY